MTKLFPNSPGNYYNHNPTSGYDQKNYYNHRPNQNRLSYLPNSPGNYYNYRPSQNNPKNKLSYFSLAQATIIIIGPTRIDLKNKLSYSPNSPRNYHNHSPSQNIPKNKLSYSQLVTQAYQGRHLWVHFLA